MSTTGWIQRARRSLVQFSTHSANPSLDWLNQPGPAPLFQPQDPRSVLFITLDSCRFDTFADAKLPNLNSVGKLHQAMAPGYFTYASHAAMFVGFTPGIADRVESFLNPKYGKIFKMVAGGFGGKGREHVCLSGRNIIDGFKLRGYRAIGAGSAGWFDPRTGTGKHLSQDFDRFYYPGNTWSLRKQLRWIARELQASRQPVFCFLNVGETHTPYYFEGAPWSSEHNPCVPFSSKNSAIECRDRQKLCVEFTDRELAPLLAAFTGCTVLLCADHGDCWGENGLWEHGIHHEKVLEVPLLFNLSSAAKSEAA